MTMKGTPNSCGGVSHHNDFELLAEIYKPSQRQKDILGKLRTSIDAIRKTDFRVDPDEKPGWFWSGGGGNGRGKMGQPEDVVEMSLKAVVGEISDLEKQVAAYEGPHFTKNYRTLQGLCSKLEIDLDALDVTGREDIREKRKTELIRIDKLSKVLSNRAHPDGKSCKDCELQV